MKPHSIKVPPSLEVDDARASVMLNLNSASDQFVAPARGCEEARACPLATFSILHFAFFKRPTVSLKTQWDSMCW